MRSTGRIRLFVILLAGCTAFAQARPPVPPEPPSARAKGGGCYLGVDIRDVTPDRAPALKLNSARGVEVVMVDQDAPAGKAGMKEQDVIQAFNGRPVENAEQLRQMIRETSPGQKVAVEVSRDGKPVTLKPTLVRRRDVVMNGFQAGGMVHVPDIQIPAMEMEFPAMMVVPFWNRHGLMVEDLTPQLGEFFGVRSGGGVLVRSVEKGTPAAAAGLKAGDVILKVNGEPVASGADWRHSLRNLRGETVSFTILRDRHEQVVTMKVPERQGQLNFPFDETQFQAQMKDLRAELEHMRPEIERAVARAQVEAQAEMAKAQKEVRKHMHELQHEWQRTEREREKEAEPDDRTPTPPPAAPESAPAPPSPE